MKLYTYTKELEYLVNVQGNIFHTEAWISEDSGFCFEGRDWRMDLKIRK